MIHYNLIKPGILVKVDPEYLDRFDDIIVNDFHKIEAITYKGQGSLNPYGEVRAHIKASDNLFYIKRNDNRLLPCFFYRAKQIKGYFSVPNNDN